MKVLMINVCCGKGSTGRICTDLAKGLEDLGHTVQIAYARDGVDRQYEKYAIQIGTEVDVKMHALKARLMDAAGFGSKKATIAFVEWVKQYDPDVIHLHNIHGYYINIEVLFNYLRTCGKKIIWTLHDCWAFTGHTAYCDVFNCERWVTGCHGCPAIREYPRSFIDRSDKNWKKKKQLMNKVPNLTIVTPSEWLAGLVRKSFLAQYSVRVIHNGIDTSLFFPQESNFKNKHEIEDKIMLLGVASAWDRMKGLQDFEYLANNLSDEYRVVLVGVTRRQKETLPTNIISIEKTESIKEMAEIYTAADLFLNLSYCENYPTVNLEAIACGTPVLTYDTGGSPESASQGENIIVKQGDMLTLIQKIKEVAGKNCINQQRNIRQLDKKETVKQYLKLYV